MSTAGRQAFPTPEDEYWKKEPGMTYHQWLVGQIAASTARAWSSTEDDDYPITQLIDEAFDVADAICAEYDRRAEAAR